MVEAPRTSRRHRVEAAVHHALERRWDLAAEANRALLDEDERDVESANRLGKALTELGDTKGAIAAYERALSIEPTNAIARKNLAKLEEQRKARGATRAARPASRAKGSRAKAGVAAETGRSRADMTTDSLRASSLIEEHGKSADLSLQRVDADAAAALSIGDLAQLESTPAGLAVQTSEGAILGYVDPRIAARLKRMLDGGNRYDVVVRRVDDDGVLVHVRESYKHPSLVGQASFLPPATARRATPRAYTKSSVVRYERDGVSDDEDDDEEDEWAPAGNTDEVDDTVDVDNEDFEDDADTEDEEDDADAGVEADDDDDEDDD